MNNGQIPGPDEFLSESEYRARLANDIFNKCALKCVHGRALCTGIFDGWNIIQMNGDLGNDLHPRFVQKYHVVFSL